MDFEPQSKRIACAKLGGVRKHTAFKELQFSGKTGIPRVREGVGMMRFAPQS